jgi:hypothetical protein
MAIRLMIVLLLAVAAYDVWWVLDSREFAWAPLPLLLVIVAYGLARGSRWGAVLWYTFAVGSIIVWVWGVLAIAHTGWPYEGLVESVVALLPGFAMTLFCVMGSVIVRRRSQSGQNANSAA